MDARDTAKAPRALVWFAALVTPLASSVYVPVVRSGSLGALGGWALPLLMWAPGVSGVVVSLAVYRSLRPLGLLGNRQVGVWLAVCLLLPIMYTLLIDLPLVAAGQIAIGTGNVVLPFFAIGLSQSLLFATGEELGWRGFAAPLLTRTFGFARGQLALGVFWFVYHLPALLATGYGRTPHPLFGNAMFLVAVVSLSVFLGWVREAGGSVWPCALFHASHNLIFLHLFDPVRPRGTAADWLIGEQGLLLALVLIVAGLVALRVAGRRGAGRPAAVGPE